VIFIVVSESESEEVLIKAMQVAKKKLLWRKKM